MKTTQILTYIGGTVLIVGIVFGLNAIRTNKVGKIQDSLSPVSERLFDAGLPAESRTIENPTFISVEEADEYVADEVLE